MSNEMWKSEAPSIFLALFFSNGGPLSIPNIISTVDYLNHSVPNREELEEGLNILFAVGLIEQKDDKFRIPEKQFQAYAAFKKKKRLKRFAALEKYFTDLPHIAGIPKTVSISGKEYNGYLDA